MSLVTGRFKTYRTSEVAFGERGKSFITPQYSCSWADMPSSNLVRLLESLFASAGATLMQREPNIEAIISQLRFIIRCTKGSPEQTVMAVDAEALLNRLDLPRSYSGAALEVSDRFFVPDKDPDEYIEDLRQQVQDFETLDEQIQRRDKDTELYKLVQQGSGQILEGLGLTIRSFDDNSHHLDEAVVATRDAENKQADLKKYAADAEAAAKDFQNGMEAYKKQKRNQMIWDITKGVCQYAFSVGLAVYTGGAAAPLTVGAVNNLLKSGAKAIEETSKLVLALKALAETVMKIYSKIETAYNNQASFTIPLMSSDGSQAAGRRNANVNELRKAADGVTAHSLPKSVAARVDYLGLLADWREFDLQVDSVFKEMEADLKGEKIGGMETYRMAMKKEVIRGETMLAALRAAYDARINYFRRRAEREARVARESELKQLSRLMLELTAEAQAWPMIKWTLQQELNSMKCTTFTMFHNCILALTYATNNVKYQKTKFVNLAPDSPVEQFVKQKTVIMQTETELSKQTQGFVVEVGTSVEKGAVFNEAWKTLLLEDLKVPFQILPTFSETDAYHRVRIRTVR